MPHLSLVGLHNGLEYHGIWGSSTVPVRWHTVKALSKASAVHHGRDGYLPRALAAQKCVPCEADDGALEAMGLCEAFARCEAEGRLAEACHPSLNFSRGLSHLTCVGPKDKSTVSINTIEIGSS